MTDKQQNTILRKALVDVVQKLGEMPGWKKVEDGLPPKGEEVIAFSPAQERWLIGDRYFVTSVCNYYGKREMVWFDHDINMWATHWMYRPAAPSDSTPTLAETLQAICASALGEIEVGDAN